MSKLKANQNKPKTSYSAQNNDEIEEIKQNLFSKTEKFAHEKISQEDLEDFCYDLLDTIRYQARELVDLYYSQLDPIESNGNTNSKIDFGQSPSINIYIPASQNFGQLTNQISNPYAGYQVQTQYGMRSYNNSIIPISNPYPNYQVQPIPNMQPYSPYFPVNMTNPYGPNMLSNSILTKKKKSKKSKSKKSESKDKEHNKKEKAKEKVKEKAKEKRPEPPKSKKSTFSYKIPASVHQAQTSGNVRQFPYNPQQSSIPGRFANGILNGLCRAIPITSPNAPVIIDSSSKFVTGYGYPRNVLPGGSYFQAANDDEDFWIRFDFKERSVELSSYYIDSDNIKNWEIQISDDGIEWETIDSHSDYPSTNVKSVFNVEQSRFVHFIRLHQTGEISQGTRSSLKINTIEFYGQLREN